MVQVQSAAEAANYLHVRNDWLARRKEEILEPGLPIVDPHHHLWDRENWRYLHDDLLADTNAGHNIIATVFVQARAMHRADGPEEMKPVGEVEFVNGIAAMTASGIYGKIRACAGIVGNADMMLGSRVEPVLAALDRARRRALPRHPPHHRVGRRSERAQSRQSGGAGHDGGCEIPRGREDAHKARLHVRCVDVSSAARRVDRARGRGPRCEDRAQSLRRAGRRSTDTSATRFFPVWKKSIEALAKRPNVTVKLGGLGMRIGGHGFEKNPDPPSSQMLADAWRPYMETCIAAFGPVARDVREQLPGRQGLVQLSGCSGTPARFWRRARARAEKADLFVGAAKRFYKLDGID